MARKQKYIPPTPEEIVAKKLAEFRDGNRSWVPEPTRIFEPGTQVKIGNLNEVFVVANHDGGKYVEVTYTSVDNNYGRPIRHENQVGVWEWTDVFPLRTVEEMPPVLHERDDMNLIFSTRDIDGLLSTFYHAGVDDQQDYQREYCWTEDQKQDLVESVMTNIDIGKFAFIRRDYGFNGPLYEIIDGKQRAKAIRDFYEDRFRWRGLLFSELHYKDQHHFTSTMIGWGETTNVTQEQKYRYFLKLNVGGVPQSQEHLNKVFVLMKAEQEKK